MKESNEKVFRLNQNAWYGDTRIELRFPAEWTVKIFGDQFIPTLSDSKIQHKIRTPIGSPPLSELAAGKSRVSILLDDLSRPTPTARLLPVVLDELSAAGIKPENITIVIAGGTHLPASANEVVKKTGGDLPSGVRVMAHDCRQALVDLGRTARGTPIQINQQVYESDLKIGIGCIYPHQLAGFSGGAKILVPGAAGYETIRALHDNMLGSMGRAGSIQNQFRDEVGVGGNAVAVACHRFFESLENGCRDVCWYRIRHHETSFFSKINGDLKKLFFKSVGKKGLKISVNLSISLWNLLIKDPPTDNKMEKIRIQVSLKKKRGRLLNTRHITATLYVCD